MAPENMTARPRILIVDDDAVHRRMLDTVLSGEGYHTAQAADGQAAVDAVPSPS